MKTSKIVRIIGLVIFIIGLIMIIYPFTAFGGYDIQKTSILFIITIGVVGVVVLVIGFLIATYKTPKESKIK